MGVLPTFDAPMRLRPDSQQWPVVLPALIAIFVLTAGNLPAQDEKMKGLNEAPRHHQWVTIKGKDVEVQSFLVFPEVKEKVLAVSVIHENRGLTDWGRSLA